MKSGFLVLMLAGCIALIAVRALAAQSDAKAPGLSSITTARNVNSPDVGHSDSTRSGKRSPGPLQHRSAPGNRQSSPRATKFDRSLTISGRGAAESSRASDSQVRSSQAVEIGKDRVVKRARIGQPSAFPKQPVAVHSELPTDKPGVRLRNPASIGGQVSISARNTAISGTSVHRRP
jgi:hypothetical protein